MEFAIPVIVASPGVIAVITPCLLTVSTLLSLVYHSTFVSLGINFISSPTSNVSFSISIANGTASFFPLTTILHSDFTPFTLFSAMTTHSPSPLATTFPSLVISATEGFELFHTISLSVASAGFITALN